MGFYVSHAKMIGRDITLHVVTKIYNRVRRDSEGVTREEDAGDQILKKI